MPQAVKIPAAKAAVDKEWEQLEKISAWNLTKVQSKDEVIDEARTSGATVQLASLMDMSFENAELEENTKSSKVELYSVVILYKTIQDLTQYSPNKDHQHKWQQQKLWISSPDFQVAEGKQQTQYLLEPK